MIIYNKNKFHLYKNNILYSSQGNSVYYLSNNGNLIKNIKIKRISKLCKFSLYGRLTRMGIQNILRTSNGLLVIVIKKNILVYKDENLINIIKIKKGSRPLRNGIIAYGDQILYGDYWSNPERDSVNVYTVDPISGKSNVLLSFNNVRHVHFIENDELNKDNLIIGTGDRNEESGFYLFNMKKRKLTILGNGSQKWRAVSILQKGNKIFWGSDCPYKKNYIYEYNRETDKFKKLCSIDGPAYYSAINKNGSMFIATTIEKRKQHRACIYKSVDEKKWTVIKEFRKDIFNEKLFGYGVIEFIRGQEKLNNLYINLNGLIEKGNNYEGNNYGRCF